MDSVIQLECYECGNKWGAPTRGKDIEDFMHKSNNRARKCPKCGGLGIPAGLRKKVKQKDITELGPYKNPKFQTGDIVQTISGRVGVVLDPAAHWSQSHSNDRGFLVTVHFKDRPFRMDYRGGGNYEFVLEDKLELVKRRNKNAMVGNELLAFAEYYSKTCA